MKPLAALLAAVLLCAIPSPAQEAATRGPASAARIPLRVGLYISDAVLAYKPRFAGSFRHAEFGKRLAESVAPEFDRTFTSVVRLTQFPADAKSQEGLNCVIVVELPKVDSSGFFTSTNSVSLPFSVFSPSGERILQTTEEGTAKSRNTFGAVRDSWFELANAAIASFLDKFSQTDLARKALLRATTATLKILSQPPRAQVYVDEKFAGATSADRGELALESLSPGAHSLRLVAADYQDWSQTVTLTAGNAANVEAKLVPRFSQLLIQSQPGNAQVYLDDAFKGVTSGQEGRLRIENLAPGSHRLRLTLQGYKEWSQTTLLGPGETLPVSAKLESAGPKPLGLDEIVDALGSLPNARVTALVKQYGVDFALTPEAEQRLRAAGADADVLLAIATSKK